VEAGNDCQAAEDDKHLCCVCLAWLDVQSGYFFGKVPHSAVQSATSSCSIKANPAKAGDAKLRVYSLLRETDYDRRATENDTILQSRGCLSQGEKNDTHAHIPNLVGRVCYSHHCIHNLCFCRQ
jgi:hypothetical protein